MLWQIIPEALEAACRELKLRHPVVVKPSNGTRTTGSHGFRLHEWPDGTLRETHVISLSKRYSPERANQTLWHELCHAIQSERLGRAKFNKAYFEQNRRFGYKRNSFEVEANALAEKKGDQMLLRDSTPEERAARGGGRYRIEELGWSGRWTRPYNNRARLETAIAWCERQRHVRRLRIVDALDDDRVVWLGHNHSIRPSA